MSQWIQKSTISVVAFGLSISAYAVAPGFYLGLAAGPATNSGKTQQAQVTTGVTTPVTPRSGQFGSRVLMGYKVNDYAGVEGGINYFSSVRYDTKNVNTCSGVSAQVRDFDLLGKGSFPLGSGFDVYGKAGVAFTYLTTSGALNPGNNPGNTQCGKTERSTKFNPAFGIGASYDLSQNWVADLSWSRVNVGNVVGNIDFYALGISYHFVNIYCGQFLC